jgi:dihydroorotate dehydrogenase electron transfer subunit
VSPAVLTAPWRQVAARVSRHDDYGAGHRWLDLEIAAEFETPAAGQFVQLLLGWPSPVLLPRPMSVAAVRRGRRGLTLGFLYAPVGAGTAALARLPRGASLDVLGPLGRGFPLATPGTPVLMAGGRGVAPLLFAAEALARARRRATLLFGARDRQHLVGLREARERIERLGGRLHLATVDGSRGARGTVLELLERLAPELPAPLVLHACGPHGMLKAVAAWALERRAPAFLAMESVMACGTGVCRGCPMPRSESGRAAYRRERESRPSLYGSESFAMCCTEGPVFGAEELDWARVE